MSRCLFQPPVPSLSLIHISLGGRVTAVYDSLQEGGPAVVGEIGKSGREDGLGPVSYTHLYGTSGLLHMPTADMQKDKTVMLGGNVLDKHPLSTCLLYTSRCV